MNKTILITGGTGFLGSHLVHSLLENGYRIIILKRSASNTWRLDDILDKLVFYDIDLYKIEAAFEEQHIDIVIHTACCYGRNHERLSSIVDTNIMLGIKLFECAEVFDTGIFINTDTFFNIQSQYLHSYVLSKKQLVDWLKYSAGKVQVINMKLEHMYGPNDNKTKFIHWVITQLEQNVKQINLTSGLQERDFIYITDVVSAYEKVIEYKNKLEKFCEFDVGTGNTITVRQFVSELANQYKKMHHENKTELVFGNIPYHDGEMMQVTVNIDQLKKTGWIPNVFYMEGVMKLLISPPPQHMCVLVVMTKNNIIKMFCLHIYGDNFASVNMFFGRVGAIINV